MAASVVLRGNIFQFISEPDQQIADLRHEKCVSPEIELEARRFLLIVSSPKEFRDVYGILQKNEDLIFRGIRISENAVDVDPMTHLVGVAAVLVTFPVGEIAFVDKIFNCIFLESVGQYRALEQHVDLYKSVVIVKIDISVAGTDRDPFRISSHSFPLLAAVRPGFKPDGKENGSYRQSHSGFQ